MEPVPEKRTLQWVGLPISTDHNLSPIKIVVTQNYFTTKFYLTYVKIKNSDEVNDMMINALLV